LNEYAAKNKVWMVSPTTLISTLSMIQMVVRNLERDKQAKVIIEELSKLGDEFKRYVARWEKLNKSIDSLSKTAKEVNISSSKISNRFKHISDAKFDLIDYDLDEDTEIDTEDDLD